MSLVDPPHVLEQGLIGLAPVNRSGGTGSISTLHLDADEAAEAERRKVPVGFRPSMEDMVRAATRAGALAEAIRIEAELRNIGECLWTARDVIQVVSEGGRLSVREVA